MPAKFKFKDLCKPGNPFDYDEAWEAELRDGGRYTAPWKDIAACGVVYPEHSAQAEAFILDILGYLPYHTIYMPHEVFIRTLIAELDSGKITQTEFTTQATEHVRHIRNDDMLREDVLLHPMRSREELDRYENYLAAYAPAAKARLAQLLGYAPIVNDALDAELLLREYAAQGKLGNTLAEIKPHECKAMTIVKFRELFLQRNGYNIALASPLFDWKARLQR